MTKGSKKVVFSMPLMVRSARTIKEEKAFITTVNVFFMDIIKLMACSVILIVNEKSLIRYYKLKVL